MADLRSTLFVGNLSVFCTEKEIEQVFTPYGHILEIRMAKSEDQSKHLSYGFIKFANVASAQLAMHDLNGVVLCGRPLKVGKALSRTTKKGEGEETPHQSYSTASVHVTFISHQIDRIVTEESLRYLFSRFGQVMDAVICKSNIDKRQGRQSGYGFIHYPGTQEGVEASFAASETLTDVMIDEVNYKCKISRDLEVQLKGSSEGAVEVNPSPHGSRSLSGEMSFPTSIPAVHPSFPRTPTVGERELLGSRDFTYPSPQQQPNVLSHSLQLPQSSQQLGQAFYQQLTQPPKLATGIAATVSSGNAYNQQPPLPLQSPGSSHHRSLQGAPLAPMLVPPSNELSNSLVSPPYMQHASSSTPGSKSSASIPAGSYQSQAYNLNVQQQYPQGYSGSNAGFSAGGSGNSNHFSSQRTPQQTPQQQSRQFGMQSPSTQQQQLRPYGMSSPPTQEAGSPYTPGRSLSSAANLNNTNKFLMLQMNSNGVMDSPTTRPPQQPSQDYRNSHFSAVDSYKQSMGNNTGNNNNFGGNNTGNSSMYSGFHRTMGSMSTELTSNSLESSLMIGSPSTSHSGKFVSSMSSSQMNSQSSSDTTNAYPVVSLPVDASAAVRHRASAMKSHLMDAKYQVQQPAQMGMMLPPSTPSTPHVFSFDDSFSKLLSSDNNSTNNSAFNSKINGNNGNNSLRASLLASMSHQMSDESLSVQFRPTLDLDDLQYSSGNNVDLSFTQGK